MITSSRNVQIEFSGDISTQIIQSALDNPASTATTLFVDLPIGDNPLPAPFSTGLIVTGLTIIPPAGNLNTITLKGEITDVGIPLHLTDPTSIALPVGFINSGEIVLSVTVQTNGVQLIWT